MKKLFALLLLLAVLFTSCAEPAAVEIQMPSDPYTPLFVSSTTERDEDGNIIYRCDEDDVQIESLKYNYAKDPDKQTVVSDMLACTAGPGLDLYAAGSDLIVVGTVAADSEEVETPVMTGTPVDDKIKEMTGGSLPMTCKYYHYIVPETILWQMDAEKELGETIDVYQFASEIQMKKGDKVVCFLNDRGERGWVGVCFEHAIFKVTEDGHMCSFSDYMDLSQYDSLTLKEFENLLIDYIPKVHYAVTYEEYCKAKDN